MRDFFKTIFSKDNSDPLGEASKTVLLYGNLFLALVSVILTLFNAAKHYWLMCATTTFLVVGFLVSALLAKIEKYNLSRGLTALICMLMFSFYAATGQNDGFAILWILLIPIIATLLVGLRLGFFISAYFQLFLIVLFYTPLREHVTGYYSPTFIMRFPVLYFASFGAITFLMCQRQNLFNEVHRQAYLDALTELHNRYYFNEMRKKVDDLKKYPSLTVVSMDLNRLKYTNDNFGHEAGDEMIRGVADLMRASFPDDMCFRTGGDEFMVISERDDLKDEVQAFKEAMGVWKGRFVASMNVSVGTASRIEEPEMTLEELTSLSDKRMYAEKSAYYRDNHIDRRSR